jgi:putative peptidoglycan lipid II flippase
MASRVLGVAREVMLASIFGRTDEMDAYRFAFRVPNLLRDLFAEGAMSAAFVPTFTKRLTADGKASALRLGLSITNALLLITGIVVLLGIVFARPIVALLVEPDYMTVPGKFELTVQLSRIMMPFLTFIALAATAMGMLNALHYFFLPALSPALFNVVSISATLALLPLMPRVGLHPIASIAIGTLIGGFAQWAVQWPLLRREGFRYRPVLDHHDEGLRRMLLMMGPGTLGLAATQVNLLVSSYLASEATGVISSLEWAFRLMYLPIGLFGVSIASATLPAVSRHSTAEDLGSVRTTVADGLSLMFTLNVPATVGLIVLATPIVQVMYEHGKFTAADTAFTAAVLQLYAIGLVGYSIVRIVSPVFYALGANRTPVVVSVITVLLNAALSYMLVRRTSLGYDGLPLATSIAALFNASLLLLLLRRRLGGIEGRQLSISLMKIAMAAIVMGGVALGAHRLLTASLPDRMLVIEVLRLVLTIGLALAALAGAAHALRIREFHQALAGVTRRLGIRRR